MHSSSESCHTSTGRRAEHTIATAYIREPFDISNAIPTGLGVQTSHGAS